MKCILSGYLLNPESKLQIRIQQWNATSSLSWLCWSSARENSRSLNTLEFEILVAEMQDENLSGAACRLECVFVGGGC